MVQPHCRHGLTTPTHPQTTYYTPAKAAALLEDGRVWHRCTTTRKPCLACTRQHGLLLGSRAGHALQPGSPLGLRRSEDTKQRFSQLAWWKGGARRAGCGGLGLCPAACPARPAQLAQPPSAPALAQPASVPHDWVITVWVRCERCSHGRGGARELQGHGWCWAAKGRIFKQLQANDHAPGYLLF